MRFLCITALVAVLWTTTVVAEYLPEPNKLWSVELEKKTKKGNAVVARGDRIFITTEDGSLHIVNPNDLANFIRYEPTPVVDFATSCESGVAFVEDGDGVVEYVVYAVVDTPNDVVQSTTSRVLGINVDGSLRWNMTVPGTAIGTPVVGASERVYMIHNEKPTNDDDTVGRISVLDGAGAKVVATLPDNNNNNVDPLGPATGRTVIRDAETVDVILFGESRREGLSQNGALYMLLPSDRFGELDGEGNESFNFITITDSLRSVTTRPAVNQDATKVFLAQQASRLSGWTDQDALSGVLQNGQGGIGDASWNRALGADAQDPLRAIRTAPVLSSDGSLLYLVGNANRVYCFQADQGELFWIADTSGTHYAEPVPHEVEGKNPVVYFIERDTGTVRQYDSSEGRRNWSIDCTDISEDENCEVSVEADFSLDTAGDVLYFADTNGKLVALAVANFATPAPTQTPTISPTAVPTEAFVMTARPSNAPTEAKVVTDVDIDEETGKDATGLNKDADASGDDDDSSLQLPILLGAVCGGAFFMIILALCILRRSRGRKSPAGQEQYKEQSLAASKIRIEEFEYELECRKLEEETLKEIGAQKPPVTPPQAGRNKPRKRSNSASQSPMNTPMTLSSIAESPNDFDDGTVTSGEKGGEAGIAVSKAKEENEEQAQPTPRNLLDSFSAASESTAPRSPSPESSKAQSMYAFSEVDDKSQDSLRSEEGGRGQYHSEQRPSPEQKENHEYIEASFRASEQRPSPEQKERVEYIEALFRDSEQEPPPEQKERHEYIEASFRSETPSDLCSLDSSLYIDASTVASCTNTEATRDDKDETPGEHGHATKDDDDADASRSLMTDVPDDESSVRGRSIPSYMPASYSVKPAVKPAIKPATTESSKTVSEKAATLVCNSVSAGVSKPAVDESKKPPAGPQYLLPPVVVPREPESGAIALRAKSLQDSPAYKGESLKPRRPRAGMLSSRLQADPPADSPADPPFHPSVDPSADYPPVTRTFSNSSSVSTPKTGTRTRTASFPSKAAAVSVRRPMILKRKPAPGPMPNKAKDNMWSSFMSELSKAEQQFFNPKLPSSRGSLDSSVTSSDSSAPVGGRRATRSRYWARPPSPPPPPPPRRGSQKYEDSDEDSGSDIALPPGPRFE